jgi:hypothetical protein
MPSPKVTLSAWSGLRSKPDVLAAGRSPTRGICAKQRVRQQLIIEYLATHAAPGTSRPDQLVGLAREHWAKVGDQVLLDQLLPGIGPAGPEPRALNLSRYRHPPRW